MPLTDHMVLSDINKKKLQLISSAVKQVAVIWQAAEQKKSFIAVKQKSWCKVNSCHHVSSLFCMCNVLWTVTCMAISLSVFSQPLNVRFLQLDDDDDLCSCTILGGILSNNMLHFYIIWTCFFQLITRAVLNQAKSWLTEILISLKPKDWSLEGVEKWSVSSKLTKRKKLQCMTAH